MQSIITGIICFILGFGFQRMITRSKRIEEEKEQRIQIEEQERLASEMQKAKKEAEHQELWNERLKQFGQPTKVLEWYSDPNRNIAVYESLKIIFINGTKYVFSDILSCRVDTKTKVTKGKETHITKPDSGEMAIEQVLWGMGKKYNVQSKTEIIRESDSSFDIYNVFIGVNNIKCPQEYIRLYSPKKVNELISLIDVIITRNNN